MMRGHRSLRIGGPLRICDRRTGRDKRRLTPLDTKHTQTDDTSAEDLVAYYAATGAALEQTDKKKAARMMTEEFLVRAYERASVEQGNAEADALLAEIERRKLDV